MGFTKRYLASKATGLASGTMITVPEISEALRSWASFTAATIPEYSHPCSPAMMTSVGPAFLPWMIETGRSMLLAALSATL